MKKVKLEFREGKNKADNFTNIHWELIRIVKHNEIEMSPSVAPSVGTFHSLAPHRCNGERWVCSLISRPVSWWSDPTLSSPLLFPYLQGTLVLLSEPLAQNIGNTHYDLWWVSSSLLDLQNRDVRSSGNQWRTDCTPPNPHFERVFAYCLPSLQFRSLHHTGKLRTPASLQFFFLLFCWLPFLSVYVLFWP